MDCLWTIQLHPAMLILLVCDEIVIEKKEGCSYDYMEILEGDGLHSIVIERHLRSFESIFDGRAKRKFEHTVRV